MLGDAFNKDKGHTGMKMEKLCWRIQCHFEVKVRDVQAFNIVLR